MNSASQTMASQPSVTKTGQNHENEKATMVIVCAPAMLSKMMGALHPAGALYEKPVNIDLAKQAHSKFVSVLKRRGIEVRDVRDILLQDASWSVGERMRLEKMAFKCLTYVFREGADEDIAGKKRIDEEEIEARKFYVSDQYKRSVIEGMGTQQLVDIILTNPTVFIRESQRDTGFTATYQFEPLSNIVFVRDQQITTRKGIVMARLRSQQRQREVDIMEICFEKLGLEVIGRVPSPGHLEGGDFFPLGEGLALIGIGARSDWPAVEYLLENDLIGSKTVAVVKDELDMSNERMHLDTVFNVIGEDCCVMLDSMMGTESAQRRTVDEYVLGESTQTDECGTIGKYMLKRDGIEFSDYIRDKGFYIIKVSSEEQKKYGCNVLNLGNGDVIGMQKDTARRMCATSRFRGSVECIDFSAVACMYGGLHCATQVVHRSAALR